jgi:hypothetical protein
MQASGFFNQDVWDEVPQTLKITIKRPTLIPSADGSIEFHAARILLLLKYIGTSKPKKIVSRTKIAKIDFFVRYPTYLEKAAKILGEERIPHFSEIYEPESRMIRYKYGPWDKKYYNIFAYLTAKGMIEVEPSGKGDIFVLTNKGSVAAEELEGPEYEEIIQRCKLVKKLFGSRSGTGIKKFIYEKFPEVVGKEVGEVI